MTDALAAVAAGRVTCGRCSPGAPICSTTRSAPCGGGSPCSKAASPPTRSQRSPGRGSAVVSGRGARRPGRPVAGRPEPNRHGHAASCCWRRSAAVALEELEAAGESEATLDRHARWVEDWSGVARAAPPTGWLIDPDRGRQPATALRHLAERGATSRAIGLLADAITPVVFTGHREEADRVADELRLAAPDDPITTARLGEIDMIRAEWRGDFIALAHDRGGAALGGHTTIEAGRSARRSSPITSPRSTRAVPCA